MVRTGKRQCVWGIKEIFFQIINAVIVITEEE
jgi:hypothetical protein